MDSSFPDVPGAFIGEIWVNQFVLQSQGFDCSIGQKFLIALKWNFVMFLCVFHIQYLLYLTFESGDEFPSNFRSSFEYNP